MTTFKSAFLSKAKSQDVLIGTYSNGLYLASYTAGNMTQTTVSALSSVKPSSIVTIDVDQNGQLDAVYMNSNNGEINYFARLGNSFRTTPTGIVAASAYPVRPNRKRENAASLLIFLLFMPGLRQPIPRHGQL